MFLPEPSVLKIPDAASSQGLFGEACTVNQGGTCVDGTYTVNPTPTPSCTSNCGWTLVGTVVTVTVTVTIEVAPT